VASYVSVPLLNLSFFIYYIFSFMIQYGNVELRNKIYMMIATLAAQASQRP
jgi:hypothetical protein